MKKGQRDKGQSRDCKEGPERQGTGAETVKRGLRDKQDRSRDCEEGPERQGTGAETVKRGQRDKGQEQRL